MEDRDYLAKMSSIYVHAAIDAMGVAAAVGIAYAVLWIAFGG